MNAKQQKIVDSVMSCIPQKGWTRAAFVQGLKKAGVTPAEARSYFPQGIDDVAEHFAQKIDDAMQTRIKNKRGFAGMRVRDKIKFAIRARLEAIETDREAIRRLLVRAMLPRHLGKSARRLWQSADLIWVLAGDTSTDYNRYTKRLLLIGVMKSTLSFWLNDTSPDYIETWAFLDRRIDDVMRLGKGLSVVKTIGVSDIVSFARARFAR